jgi:hypothetical protein
MHWHSVAWQRRAEREPDARRREMTWASLWALHFHEGYFHEGYGEFTSGEGHGDGR